MLQCLRENGEDSEHSHTARWLHGADLLFLIANPDVRCRWWSSDATILIVNARAKSRLEAVREHG
jgi:hypothetical protein